MEAFFYKIACYNLICYWKFQYKKKIENKNNQTKKKKL